MGKGWGESIDLLTSWRNIFFCHSPTLSFPNPILLYTFHKESNVELGTYCHYHLVRFKMLIRCFGNLFCQIMYSLYFSDFSFSLICLLSISNQSHSYPTFTKTKEFDHIPGSGSSSQLFDGFRKSKFLKIICPRL